MYLIIFIYNIFVVLDIKLTLFFVFKIKKIKFAPTNTYIILYHALKYCKRINSVSTPLLYLLSIQCYIIESRINNSIFCI